MKTDIIQNAFDKLYANLGNDLSSLLGSTLKNTGKSWKGYGTKWTFSTDPDWFLLEVTPKELDMIWKAANTTTKSIKDHVFPTVYKAKTHDPKSFLLRKEVGTNRLSLIIYMFAFFRDCAADMGAFPYLTPEELDELLRPSKGYEREAPISSNVCKPVVLSPSADTKPEDEANDDIVIVDYVSPYSSFSYHGAIHLEINRKNNTISSKGWANGKYPLFPQEERIYLDFFSNVRNLNAFFNDRWAYSTDAAILGAHHCWYEMRVQWHGYDKKISVGSPAIPFKHPFWH